MWRQSRRLATAWTADRLRHWSTAAPLRSRMRNCWPNSTSDGRAGTWNPPEAQGRFPALRLALPDGQAKGRRSEEHTSELQSLMRISYAVFCLKKKNTNSIKRQKHKRKQ